MKTEKQEASGARSGTATLTALQHLRQRLHRRLLGALEAGLGEQRADHHLQRPPPSQVIVIGGRAGVFAARALRTQSPGLRDTGTPQSPGSSGTPDRLLDPARAALGWAAGRAACVLPAPGGQGPACLSPTANTHLYTRVHTYTRISLYIYIHTHIYTHKHVYTHKHAHIHTHTCIKTHTHIHTYTYRHIHTYTHTHRTPFGARPL